MAADVLTEAKGGWVKSKDQGLLSWSGWSSAPAPSMDWLHGLEAGDLASLNLSFVIRKLGIKHI